MADNKREIGGRYENVAAAFLQQKGLQILVQNYRCRSGEIDIIAREQDTIVFCEVKYRNAVSQGDPSEAVDYHKQQKIFRVAEVFLTQELHRTDVSCRFDVIAIRRAGESLSVRWIPDAFGSF